MTALLSASLIVTVIASQKLALESMSSDFFASFLSYLFLLSLLHLLSMSAAVCIFRVMSCLFHFTKKAFDFSSLLFYLNSYYSHNIIIIIIIRHAPSVRSSANSLHSGLSRASSTASSKVRLCRDRSFFRVAIQEV